MTCSAVGKRNFGCSVESVAEPHVCDICWKRDIEAAERDVYKLLITEGCMSTQSEGRKLDRL